jgi:hypothetical protein
VSFFRIPSPHSGGAERAKKGHTCRLEFIRFFSDWYLCRKLSLAVILSSCTNLCPIYSVNSLIMSDGCLFYVVFRNIRYCFALIWKMLKSISTILLIHRQIKPIWRWICQNLSGWNTFSHGSLVSIYCTLVFLFLIYEEMDVSYIKSYYVVYIYICLQWTTIISKDWYWFLYDIYIYIYIYILVLIFVWHIYILYIRLLII